MERIITAIVITIIIGSLLYLARPGQMSNFQALKDVPTATPEPTMPPRETFNPVTKLETKDLVVGKGKTAVKGSKVTVHYTGWLSSGVVFDSSLKPGREPFEVTLGNGEVIAGWDEGLIGMKEGGKRLLTIPPDKAYGASGAGPIPANSSLRFEVELLKVE